ncbi:hypothetical protein GCM10020256_70270 [Streptomyces thermocoprophilus]
MPAPAVGDTGSGAGVRRAGRHPTGFSWNGFGRSRIRAGVRGRSMRTVVWAGLERGGPMRRAAAWWRRLGFSELHRRGRDLELLHRAMGFATLALVTLAPLLIVIAAADPLGARRVRAVAGGRHGSVRPVGGGARAGVRAAA